MVRDSSTALLKMHRSTQQLRVERVVGLGLRPILLCSDEAGDDSESMGVLTGADYHLWLWVS